MGKGWKISIAAVALIAVLLGLNALAVDRETKPAEVTVPGGRILELPGGSLQVVDRGARGGSPIVLLHCFTCAIDWWDAMMPSLERAHRVVALDMLGFGGSEKPGSGYSIENEARLVAQALARLGVRDATVVGHSLGGTVATALAEESPRLVGRLAIVDQAPDSSYEPGDLAITTALTFLPVIGQALWRIAPDSAIKDGLGTAFEPGFDVPDRFVADFHRMTYTSYDESPSAESHYTGAIPLDRRIARERVPLLAIFGADDQVYDARKALAAYATVHGARTELIAGAGHSPNVEKPAQTASLLLAFVEEGEREEGMAGRRGAASKDETKRREQKHRSRARQGSGGHAGAVHGGGAGRHG